MQTAPHHALFILISFTALVGVSTASDGQSIKAAEGCAAERSFDTLLWTEPSDNGFDPQIGCPARANLNAMISRKRDLVKGRGTRYFDGERAANIVKQYREAKPAAPKTAGDQKATGEAKPTVDTGN